MAEVTLSRVSKSFGDIQAVKELDFTIADGELVVLLGPTGAGKTTTLRLVAGLEKPDAGDLLIDGEAVTGLPPSARDVSFVFQQYSLYPHYTVFDNLAFPLRAPGRRLPKAEIAERVHEVASLLRIESKLQNKATHLSGGEMQRVAIGRALVRTPSIYLMDEPLSSLDAKLREDLRIELKRIQKDLGATILYVTHDQLEAMTLADRIGVLSEGELVQLGTPREVYETPANIHVARRLGSPQINILAAGSLGVTEGPSAAASIGLRPEDVVLGAGGTRGRILTVENLGVETVVLLEVEGKRVHALLPAGESMEEGDETGVSVRPGSALYFDQSGQRIGWMESAGAERRDRHVG